MNEVHARVAKRALELAEAVHRQGGAELRAIADEVNDSETLRQLLLDVGAEIRGASDVDEAVRHLAYSLMVYAFDPRRENDAEAN